MGGGEAKITYRGQVHLAKPLQSTDSSGIRGSLRVDQYKVLNLWGDEVVIEHGRPSKTPRGRKPAKTAYVKVNNKTLPNHCFTYDGKKSSLLIRNTGQCVAEPAWPPPFTGAELKRWDEAATQEMQGKFRDITQPKDIMAIREVRPNMARLIEQVIYPYYGIHPREVYAALHDESRGKIKTYNPEYPKICLDLVPTFNYPTMTDAKGKERVTDAGIEQCRADRLRGKWGKEWGSHGAVQAIWRPIHREQWGPRWNKALRRPSFKRLFGYAHPGVTPTPKSSALANLLFLASDYRARSTTRNLHLGAKSTGSAAIRRLGWLMGVVTGERAARRCLKVRVKASAVHPCPAFSHFTALLRRISQGLEKVTFYAVKTD